MSEDLQVTWETLLAVCGGIAVVAGGVRVVARLFSPFRALRTQVGRHTEMLERDNRRIDREEESTRVIMRAMFALLNHEITGNSVDELKRARDTIQAHLAER
jgi:predicted amino acid dehydrogenase